MIKNKPFIDKMLGGKSNIELSVRTLASDVKHYSEFMPFNHAAHKLLYNSKLIDGVKFKFDKTIVGLNARHKFF